MNWKAFWSGFREGFVEAFKWTVIVMFIFATIKLVVVLV